MDAVSTHTEVRSAAPPASRSAVTTQDVRVHISKRGSTLGANSGTKTEPRGPIATNNERTPPAQLSTYAKIRAMDGILHSVQSFHSIYRSVVITMIISAFMGEYLVSPELRAEGRSLRVVASEPPGCKSNTSELDKLIATQFCAQWSATLCNSAVYDCSGVPQPPGCASVNSTTVLTGVCSYVGPADAATEVGNAVVSVLVIIGVFIGQTFLIVLCYKYNLMRLLTGFIGLSVAVCLGMMSFVMWDVAVRAYAINADWATSVICVYNFSAVGIIAIFYQKGVPWGLVQSYLVAVSVIMAWQIHSMFPDIFTWALLIALSLYDLYAVLTPVGPLRCLIELVMKEGRELPALLYEADVKDKTGGARSEQPQSNAASRSSASTNATVSTGGGASAAKSDSGQSAGPSQNIYAAPTALNPTAAAPAATAADSNSAHADVAAMPDQVVERLQAYYKQHRPEKLHGLEQNIVQNKAILRKYSGRWYGLFVDLDEKYSTSSATDVECKMWTEYKNHMVEAQRRQQQEAEMLSPEDRTIKLGLGDYVFYSVFVARAAGNGWAGFATAIVVVLYGLGSTLVLLSVFEKALPALPISLLVGLSFYFMCEELFVPLLAEFHGQPVFM